MAPRKTAIKTAKSEELVSTKSENDLSAPSETFKSRKKIRIPLKLVSLVLVIVAFLAGAFLTKDWYLAAIVNNKPITRFSLDRELEKQGGQQVLDSKITEMLILDEAGKQKINIAKADIDARIKQIEDQITQQGSKLDDLLKQRNETRSDLEYQVKLQLIVESLLGKDITVTDAEISTYFTTNKGYYPTGTKLEDKKEEIRTTLQQQKLSEKLQTYIEELKKKASIHYLLKL